MSLDINDPVVQDSWRGFLVQLGMVAAGMLLVIALASLAGCGAQPVQQQVKTEVVTVKTKVREPCIEQAPDEPDYRWGVGDKPDTDKEKVAILLADYEQARQYGVDWKAAAVGCVKSQ